MHKKLLTIAFITLLLPIISYGYPPTPAYDNHCSIDLFGNDILLRHFEGRKGWNGSQSDGPQLALYIGSSELVRVSRALAITVVCLILVGIFYFIRRAKSYEFRHCNSL